MFSKPLAFILLALGCLTAAAGGAYVATRHNMSQAAASAPAAALASPAAGSQPAPAASKAVAETETAVSRPAEALAPAAAPAPTAVPAPAAEAAPATVHAEAPAAPHSGRTTEVARKADQPATPAPATRTASARPPQRTVPMTNPGPAVTTPEPAAPPTAPAPAAPSPAPTKAPNDTPAKPADDPQPETPKAAQFEELIVPAASVIGLQVETSLSTERARVEDRVDARVSRDVMAAGRVAIPAGSRVIGSVTSVDRGGKVKEQARLGIRFHTLVLADGTQVPLHTDPVYRLGEDPSAGSSKKIGGAAIGGAIIGAILGGGKGAAIGGATGAAGGTAAVMAGDRQPATLRPGEYLNVKLSSPATITVERRDQ